MKTLQYETGRQYNGLQVLEITIEDKTIDDYGFVDYTITFRDSSRAISGRVNLFFQENSDIPCNLGKRVLDVYDAGNYALI